MKKLIVAAVFAFGLFGIVSVAPHQTQSSQASIQVADGPPEPMSVTNTTA